MGFSVNNVFARNLLIVLVSNTILAILNRVLHQGVPGFAPIHQYYGSEHYLSYMLVNNRWILGVYAKEKRCTKFFVHLFLCIKIILQPFGFDWRRWERQSRKNRG